MLPKNILLLFLIVLLGCNGDDTTEAPQVPEEEVRLNLVNAFPHLSFEDPLDLQSPADETDRIFVVEQAGLVKVFSNNQEVTQSSVFLDISNRTDTSGGEMGLLGLSFHPDYASNGFFYVYYTPGPAESVLSRFSVSSTDPDSADPLSETILFRIEQPYTNHNGGQVAFGPDGYLYLATGDGGSGGDPHGNAQNLNSLLGKVLRIDVNQTANGLEYGIPADNPFRDTEGARPEVYAYGLRNPWRISFDAQTGRLWAGDVGQAEVEEIDIIEAGGNYGWNILEGSRCFGADTCNTDGLIPPVFEYGQSNGDRSVTGGYVYRGDEVPALEGFYVYADFISGRIWTLETGTDSPGNTLLQESGLNISSFGTDAQGELYLCSFDGSIYRFVQE
jgi:glucose/arabinose dehydrogenase